MFFAFLGCFVGQREVFLDDLGDKWGDFCNFVPS